MRLASKAVTAIVLFVFSMGSVTAQDTEPKLPNPDQIRQLYRETSTNWHTAPVVAMQAFVAAEDRFFYERPVGRSTITQQIGSWYLPPGAGRLQRIALAHVIGEELSHEEVLDWFVNQVFLGQTCFGVFDAAAAYFGIAVNDLSLEQAAYLAALAKSPVLFHPLQSYETAVERRNFVLNEMQRAGFISTDKVQRAIQSELTVKEPLERCEKDQ